MVNREQLVRACQHLYRRTGGDTARSGVYGDLGGHIRAAIEASLVFASAELPIAASFVDECHWLVVTTDRVMFRAGGEVTALSLSHVQEVHSRALEDGNDELPDVIVVVSDGRRYEVRVEPGHPLSGMWNVLRRLIRAWGTTE